MNDFGHYNAVEVAQQFGVVPVTIRRLALEGKIRAAKIGREWWFTKQAIEDYLMVNGK